MLLEFSQENIKKPKKSFHFKREIQRIQLKNVDTEVTNQMASS